MNYGEDHATEKKMQKALNVVEEIEKTKINNEA